MLSNEQIEFTKDNLEFYLKEVAKEYRKEVGKKMPVELILVGGASVLINYGFRNMTTDIDAYIYASSSMKDVINRVGDRYQLPNGWLNTDFSKTKSFSSKIVQFSKFYKTYANVLTIRTIESEYLIAMKLKSFRQYKNDISDIAGILKEHEENGTPITLQQVQKAVIDLYGEMNSISKEAQEFIERSIKNGEYKKTYETIVSQEKDIKNTLLKVQQTGTSIRNEEELTNILKALKKKQK